MAAAYAADAGTCTDDLGGAGWPGSAPISRRWPTGCSSSHLLCRLAEQVVIVLIPPLALIFLVLGTIFLGIATPTEGGAMGATGALVMALAKRRLSWPLLRQAMDSTAQAVVLRGLHPGRRVASSA